MLQHVDETFTVIIPTIGRATLERMLNALGAGDLLPRNLILIDQGERPCPDHWLSGLVAAGVIVDHVRAHRSSPAGARNIAWERLSTEYFAGLDDDCIPASDWLRSLRERLRQHREVVVTGQVVAPPGKVVPSTIESETESVFTKPIFEDPLMTGNFAAPKAVARKVGRFDERLNISAEDNDWGYRALKIGVPIIYAPEVRVEHEGSSSAEEIVRIHAGYARGQGMFFGKHAARGDLFILRRASSTAARFIWAWLRRLRSGADGRRAELILRSYLTGLADGVLRLSRRSR